MLSQLRRYPRDELTVPERQSFNFTRQNIEIKIALFLAQCKFVMIVTDVGQITQDVGEFVGQRVALLKLSIAPNRSSSSVSPMTSRARFSISTVSSRFVASALRDTERFSSPCAMFRADHAHGPLLPIFG